MDDTGLEAIAVTGRDASDLRQFANSRAAESGAFQAESGAESVSTLAPDDRQLRAIIDAWPTLPDAVKAAVMALIGE